MSTYYKDPATGEVIFRVAAPRMTFEEDDDGSIVEVDLRSISNIVSVKDTGGTGTGVETQRLINACNKAVSQGHKRVLIPFPTFTVADGTDCKGCTLHGADTTLTGRVFNHTGLVNIRVRGMNQSDSTKAVLPIIDDTVKLLWRNTALQDYCIVKKKSSGYLLQGYIRNSTTTSESLATTNSDVTRQRLAEVLNAVWAGVYKRTYSAVSGTWTDTSVTQPSNIVPPYTSGRALRSWTATQNGNYIEYSTKVRNGRVQFALFTGTGSAETSDIKVGSAAVVSITPPSAVSNTIKVYAMPATGVPEGETITLRITHTGTNGKSLIVIGVDFYELKDWVGSDYDEFAYFRNSAYADYLTQASANDAVIREYNSNTYGISYHGGESNITTQWYSDGSSINPTVGSFIVVRNLELRTKCDVSWASLGGGQINIESKWHPSAGGVSHSAQITGDVLVKELYTHMFGTPESFTDIVSPVRVDLTTYPDNSRIPLGRSMFFRMRNPTTGQSIGSQLTLFEREQNQWGGIHIWKIIGSYNKAYYGICLGGKMQITDIGFVSINTFD